MTRPARQYRIREPLGRGGFGTVYRAELLGGGGFTKSVAIKVLNPDVEGIAEITHRFRDEARMLGLVRHRAIVHVDGLVRLGGRWAVVMELVEGCHLGELFNAGPLPPGPALEIVAEVAGALHSAWNRPGPTGGPLRLLHRDIKLSNIQITAEGEVKVIDFGISRADFAEREAKTKLLGFGSPEYMAPESIEMFGESGPTSDIYSLGVVFYEILTGRRFKGPRNNPTWHAERVLDAMDDAWAATGEQDEGVVRLLGDMLAFSPDERPDARTVERRAGEASWPFRAVRLRDWAERAVPPLIASRPPLPGDDLSGKTLVEQGSGDAATWEEEAAIHTVFVAEAGQNPEGSELPNVQMTSDRLTIRPPWRLAVVFGGGLVALGLATIVLFAVALGDKTSSREPEGSAPASLIEPVKMVENSDLTEPSHVPTLHSEVPENFPSSAVAAAPAPELPTETTTSTPAPIPSTKTTTTTPPPRQPVEVPTPTPTATIHVKGDAKTVILLSGKARHEVGNVPPGSYTIEALFGDDTPVIAGEVVVTAGETVTLTCNARFTRCTSR